MQLLDGKKTADIIQEEITSSVLKLKSITGKTPHLVAILVGDNGASETYVNAKVRACERVGFKSTILRLEDTITEKELLTHVISINKREDVDGLIVQLPLPNHIRESAITEAIIPSKDVDGFHPINIGKMVLNMPTYLPATPAEY